MRKYFSIITSLCLFVGASTFGKILNKSKTDTSTFVSVEVMPEYPGGQNALTKYLSQNMNYPERARKKNVSGTVYISFVVGSSGEVKDAKVIRGIYDECDKEALRVVRSMPVWTPGMQDGKKVNVMFTLPIKFTLTSSSK